MRKSDKKIDNQLRIALTEVCESALKNIVGFDWLTHTVNYDNFPKSLRVICIFDNNENLENYLASEQNHHLMSLINAQLQSLDIKLKPIGKHIDYDSEENCESQHQGNWALRLS